MKYILLITFLSFSVNHAWSQKIKPWDIGVAGGIENDSLYNRSGYSFLIESIGKLISPRKVDDEQFLKNSEIIRKAKTKVYAFNLFIPGELKVVGPDINEGEVLTYVDKVFDRCEKLGIKLVVWGSGGSRRVPDGFDKQKATKQFISIAEKIAVAAKKHDVILALENLNSTETNFINTFREAFHIIKKVNHPNLRLNLDIYHMLKENEDASIIKEAASFIVHCEVAEKEGRSAPGTHQEDFTPYFKELKKSGYNGKIFIECQWKDINAQAKPAHDYLADQIANVFR